MGVLALSLLAVSLAPVLVPTPGAGQQLPRPAADAGADPDLRWTNASTAAGFGGLGGTFFTWVDHDTDGDQDLMVDGRRLYQNAGAPNWTFSDVTTSVGLPTSGHTTGAWGDLDGDGDQDVVLVGTGSDDVYLDEGANATPRYQRDANRSAAIADDGPTTAAILADADGDGHLDLYLGGGEDWNDGDPIHHHDHWYGGTATGFVDRSTEILQWDNYARGVTFGDIDRDGDADLHVGNYRLSQNSLFENIDGVLNATNAHASALRGQVRTYDGSDYYGHTIGAAIADLTGDGMPEVVSANLVHLYHDTQDIRGLICDDSHIQTFDRDGPGGWSLMRPDNGIGWKPRGGAGVHVGDELYAGAAIGDVDADGDLDLWMPQVYDLSHARAQLWINDGRGLFTEQGAAWGLDVIDTYGGAFADYDEDGDLDLVTGGRDAVGGASRIHLFRNDGPDGASANHWLRLAVDGPADALGAQVELWRDGAPLAWQEVRGAGSSHGQADDRRVFFGRGADVGAVDVLVTWPDGRLRWVRDVAVDGTLSVAQPVGGGALELQVTDAGGQVDEGLVNATVRAAPGWVWELDGGLDRLDVVRGNGTGGVGSTQVLMPQSGRHVLRLLAWDPSAGTGRWATEMLDVRNVPPAVSIDVPDEVPPQQALVFRAVIEDSAADAGHHTLRWRWDDGAWSPWSNATLVERMFEGEGTWNLSIEARDLEGALGTATASVHVLSVAPRVSIVAPAAVDMDDLVIITFAAEDTAADLPNMNYRVHVDGTLVEDWMQRTTVSLTWTEPGDHDVRVEARDPWELLGEAEASITVHNVVPSLVWAARVGEAVVGENVMHEVWTEDSQSDRQALALEWRVDGVLEATNVTMLRHAFETEGEHAVEVRVRDRHGASSLLATVVNVSAAPGAMLVLGLDEGIQDGTTLWATERTRLDPTLPWGGPWVLDDSANLSEQDGGDWAVDAGAQRVSMSWHSAGSGSVVSWTSQVIWPAIDLSPALTAEGPCASVRASVDSLPSGTTQTWNWNREEIGSAADPRPVLEMVRPLEPRALSVHLEGEGGEALRLEATVPGWVAGRPADDAVLLDWAESAGCWVLVEVNGTTAERVDEARRLHDGTTRLAVEFGTVFYERARVEWSPVGESGAMQEDPAATPGSPEEAGLPAPGLGLVFIAGLAALAWSARRGPRSG